MSRAYFSVGRFVIAAYTIHKRNACKLFKSLKTTTNDNNKNIDEERERERERKNEYYVSRMDV